MLMPKKAHGRYDARRINLPYDFNAVYPYIMKGRNESAVYYSLTVDVENLLSYIEEKKGSDREITFFQAMLLALTKVLRNRPALNRYVIGRRLYERYNVELSFIAKREFSDEGSETNVYVKINQDDHYDDILRKIRRSISSAKSGTKKEDDAIISRFVRLPRCLLRAAVKLLQWYDFYFDTPGFLREGNDPLRCSAFVANLGSVGIEAPFHHLYEWGTCSLFVAIGKIKPTVCAGKDGKPEVRRMVEVKVTLDERIADGFYFARSLDLFMEYIQNPRLLEDI